MAKANIKLKDGTLIVIEGEPDEVSAIINKLNTENIPTKQLSVQNHSVRHATVSSPTDLLISLADGGFFKDPQDLSSIKHGMEERGYKYPVTTISTLVMRLVRKRILHRYKENKRWFYTNK